jgi:hypothetical protein
VVLFAVRYLPGVDRRSMLARLQHRFRPLVLQHSPRRTSKTSFAPRLPRSSPC